VVWTKERVEDGENEAVMLEKVKARFAKSAPMERLNLFVVNDLFEKPPEAKKEEKVEEVAKEEAKEEAEKKQEEKKEAKQPPSKKPAAKK